MKKVSTSNTKAEILSAYSELMEILRQERKQNTALQRDLEKKRSIVATVAEKTKTGATHSINELKKMLNEQLDKIELGIAKEQQNFEELQRAISIEKETLEDLYKVKAEAESLEALVITNKQSKEELESDIKDRKEALQQEIENTKMKWKREQEEYEYKLKIKRRNEEDEYKQKKEKQEKALKEQKIEFDKNITIREKSIAGQEDELMQLRKEVSQFEKLLQKNIQDAEKAVTGRLTKEFEYRQKLETKDLEAELRLHKQEIQSLKSKVKEQQELIGTISTKTDSANQQVKDIALKAIENAGIRSLNFPGTERSKEDKKD
ncbi:MAG: hypothetical protein GY705_16550 [Bacteroidetes bacterium]|nr:hypothetical protein [Bacteroidota bacterium]